MPRSSVVDNKVRSCKCSATLAAPSCEHHAFLSSVLRQVFFSSSSHFHPEMYLCAPPLQASVSRAARFFAFGSGSLHYNRHHHWTWPLSLNGAFFSFKFDIHPITSPVASTYSASAWRSLPHFDVVLPGGTQLRCTTRNLSSH